MKTVKILALGLFVLSALLTAGAGLGAKPDENVLISADRVELQPAGELLVEYTLPCQYDRVVRFMLLSDDSGDRTVAVGVVYSQEQRNCWKGPKKKFSQLIDPREYGYNPGDAEEFSTLDVRNTCE